MTYDEVARVASELKEATGKATVREVFSRVGGDYNSVTGHMKTWRQQQPTISAGIPPEISPTVLKALRDELALHRGQAVAEKVSDLEQAMEEVEDLMREARLLRAERDDLKAQLGAVSSERERLIALASEMTSRIEHIERQADADRNAAENARLDLAQARLASTGDAELVAALKADRDALRADMEYERARLVESERATAAATSALKVLEGRVADLLDRTQAAEADRTGLRSSLDAERDIRHAAERERDVAQERANAAQAVASDLRERETTLRASLAMKVKQDKKSIKQSGKRGAEVAVARP